MIQPLNENLLIQLVREDNQSEIVLPQSRPKDEVQKGRVISVSPGFSEVNIGDLVLFDKFVPIKVKELGEDLCFIKLADILAVIRNENGRSQAN